MLFYKYQYSAHFPILEERMGLSFKKPTKLTSPAPRNKILCSEIGLLITFCAARRPARATAAVPIRKTKSFTNKKWAH